MPLQTKPEDLPSAVRFHFAEPDGSSEVTASAVAPEGPLPYRIQGGAPRFASRDAFKARSVEAGLTPAVAEDPDRSFNATARQLRELGFSVDVVSASAA